MPTLVVAVVNVSENTPLVMDLTGVGVASDGLFHQVEDDGWLLLNDVHGAPGGARVGAGRAALKSERPSTLAEGGDVVEPPGLDGCLIDGADDSDTVGVKLEVHHSIFYGHRLSDFARE